MKLRDLEGLIPEEVGEVLAKYGSRVTSNSAIVEIGSYKGKSACYLASKTMAHVWAIDPWDTPGNVNGRFGFAQKDTWAKFHEQVWAMGLQDRITAIKGFGVDIANQWNRVGTKLDVGMGVRLLYVDGDHSAKSVEADVRAWLPHLNPNPIIILDDWGTRKNPGVRIAADRLTKDLGPYEIEAGRLAIWK